MGTDDRRTNFAYIWSEVKSFSLVWLFSIPWTVAYPAPLSMEFSRSPGKNTGVGCHFLLQGIFPTQGSNPGLLHCRQTLYHLSYQGSLAYIESMSVVSGEKATVSRCLSQNNHKDRTGGLSALRQKGRSQLGSHSLSLLLWKLPGLWTLPFMVPSTQVTNCSGSWTSSPVLYERVALWLQGPRERKQAPLSPEESHLTTFPSAHTFQVQILWGGQALGMALWALQFSHGGWAWKY